MVVSLVVELGLGLVLLLLRSRRWQLVPAQPETEKWGLWSCLCYELELELELGLELGLRLWLARIEPVHRAR